MLTKLDALLSLIPGDGYKRIVLYVFTQIPAVSGNATLSKSLEDLVMAPGKDTLIAAAIQVAFAFAMLHGGLKLVTRK